MEFSPISFKDLKIRNIIKNKFPIFIKKIYTDPVKTKSGFYRRLALKPIEPRYRHLNYAKYINEINLEILPKGHYIFGFNVYKLIGAEFYGTFGIDVYGISLKVKEISEYEFNKIYSILLKTKEKSFSNQNITYKIKKI